MKINLLYYIINMKKSKKHIITSSKSRRMSRKGSKLERGSKSRRISRKGSKLERGSKSRRMSRKGSKLERGSKSRRMSRKGSKSRRMSRKGSKSRRMSRKGSKLERGSKSRRMSKELYIKKNILVGGANTLINEIYKTLESYKKQKFYPFTIPKQWELTSNSVGEHETNIKIKYDPHEKFEKEGWMLTINKKVGVQMLSTKNRDLLQQQIINPEYIARFLSIDNKTCTTNESVKNQIINMIKVSIYKTMLKQKKMEGGREKWEKDMKKTENDINGVSTNSVSATIKSGAYDGGLGRADTYDMTSWDGEWYSAADAR